MVQGFFPWDKADGSWRWAPTPSSAEVRERVDLYLYSPSGPSWPALRRTLTCRNWLFELCIYTAHMVMAEPVGPRPLTMDSCSWTQVSWCGICGESCGTGASVLTVFVSVILPVRHTHIHLNIFIRSDALSGVGNHWTEKYSSSKAEICHMRVCCIRLPDETPFVLWPKLLLGETELVSATSSQYRQIINQTLPVYYSAH